MSPSPHRAVCVAVCTGWGQRGAHLSSPPRLLHNSSGRLDKRSGILRAAPPTLFCVARQHPVPHNEEPFRPTVAPPAADQARRHTFAAPPRHFPLHSANLSSTARAPPQNCSSTVAGYPHIHPHFARALQCVGGDGYSREHSRGRRNASRQWRHGGSGVRMMGDFEELESERTADHAAPSPGARAASRTGAALPAVVVPELPGWRVRSRRPLDEERILEEVQPGSLEAGRVLALHRTMTTRTRLYAHHLRSLAVFFVEDPEVEGRPEDAEVSALKIAAGLRCTYDQAWAQVRDAHTAVDLMPLSFEYLRRADLTEGMHQYLLRRVRRLREEQARQVDAHLATIELPSVSWSTYIKHVRLAVELATAGALTRPPSQARDVEIVDVDTASGTASLLVTGPIPEIQGLAHRLDVQARTVQRAQRAALEDGAEGPVPFDIDQDLAQRGRP